VSCGPNTGGSVGYPLCASGTWINVNSCPGSSTGGTASSTGLIPTVSSSSAVTAVNECATNNGGCTANQQCVPILTGHLCTPLSCVFELFELTAGVVAGTCDNTQLIDDTCTLQCAAGFTYTSGSTVANCHNIGGVPRYQFDLVCTAVSTATVNITSASTCASVGCQSSVFQGCSGSGLTGQSVNLEALPLAVLAALPSVFEDRRTLAPFSVERLVDGAIASGAFPPGSYLTIRVCDANFTADISVALYQSDDNGNHWQNSLDVCEGLGTHRPAPLFIESSASSPACFSFSICHTTVFVAGSVASDSSGGVVSELHLLVLSAVMLTCLLN